MKLQQQNNDMNNKTTTHTPGFLQVAEFGIRDLRPAFVSLKHGPYTIATVGSSEDPCSPIDEANAARLVACWNACKDLPDPSIVPELVAALEDALRMVESMIGRGSALDAQRMDRYRNALARAKGVPV